jgi:hypothetical protein
MPDFEQPDNQPPQIDTNPSDMPADLPNMTPDSQPEEMPLDDQHDIDEK